ncbi:hypothetical protein AB6A40_001115 [Gnathostoma spinigerum]|uniref:Uncharacterized protein n=1 Tax=Gnathostoma spinigerum TaxID=75299 RepID=A0ABD6E4P9_9BILA
MPTSVEDFIRTKKKVLCAPYLYNSVLIFDGCSLYLCSQLFTESNATLSYGRMIELELCPPPSADLLFSSLCSNDSGSFAAIIAPYGVYLVDLPRHLWVLQSADVQSTIEQWSEKYYCRCEAVNQNLMLTDRAPLVTKFSWCKRSWKELGHSRTTKFAVLYSDDVIRLYDANVCFTSPLLKIDFRSMLSPADSSGSRFHRLGLFNSIASFDFGPRIECRDECSGETVHLSTIFAVDTEHNDIYVAAFRLDSNIVFNSIGPLALQPVLASDKASDLCDLLFLRCSESGLLNVFAFVTGDGLLVHFLPLFSCVDLVDHSLDCELYMYDMIKIPTISQEISPVIFKGTL